MTHETEDALLISRLKDPDTRDKAFLQLMDQYKKPIYWHIRRMVESHEDAEDILQETFIRVYRFAGSFKGESKLSTWLYRIAINECTMHFRKNKKRMKNTAPINGEFDGEPVHTEIGKSDLIIRKFEDAVQQLPEKQRIVFNLRYYDELSYEDIGQILNSSVNTLKTNYHYACEKIKQFLVEHAQE
jgi:RNA polymerase sigma-70 factor (ECF subfamily)